MRTNSLLHLTLNTGHRAFTSGLTPPDELATLLLPTLPLLGSSLVDLRWIGAFERIYAEALLARA